MKYSAKYFMAGTLVIWGVLDLWLFWQYGNPATESATVWHEAYLFPGLTFFVGSLMGHFFGQDRAPSTQAVSAPAWRNIGEWVLFFVHVFWLSLDSYGIFWSQEPPALDMFIWKISLHQVWLVFFVGFVFGAVFYPMDEATEFKGDR